MAESRSHHNQGGEHENHTKAVRLVDERQHIIGTDSIGGNNWLSDSQQD